MTRTKFLITYETKTMLTPKLNLSWR